MTAVSLTHSDVLRAVRTSTCATAKKQYPAKKRPGIYGQTIDHAIDRLARSLDARVSSVQLLVRQLLRENRLVWAQNRLVTASGTQKRAAAKRSAISAATDEAIILAAPTAEEPAHLTDLDRWSDMDLGDVSPGDLLRYLAWHDHPEVADDIERWMRGRSASMAAHPSSINTRQLAGVG